MRNKNYSEWRKKVFRTAREKKTFLAMQCELTGRCNLDCKMCYVHTLDHCAAKEKELTTQQWKQIFDEAHSAGLFFATLTGGECLLRPDFKELYLHLWNKRIMVSVFTNGVLLDDEYIAFFKKYPPEYIQISLYGSSENGYYKVTGHKRFEKVLSSIQSLKEAGVDVRIAVTPNAYNKDDYIDILKLCKEKDFYTEFAEMILTANRENPTKDDYYLSIDEMTELSIQRALLYTAIEPTDNLPAVGNNTVHDSGLKCNAGNCICIITWDGKMQLCINAMFSGYDVRELGFREAWERTKAAAAQVMLPAECVGCPYEAVCVKCPALRSPKLDGHCDPQVCELTRRLVASGVKKL